MATTSTAREKSTSGTAVLTCPECGRTFARPAALGAHRKMKHGVAGSSANAAGNRSAASRKRSAAAPRRRRATTATASNGSTQGIDRDALLRTLFPNGIPPRQDVIGQVNSWLDEAERLARTS
jgi:hypothetical protein